MALRASARALLASALVLGVVPVMAGTTDSGSLEPRVDRAPQVVEPPEGADTVHQPGQQPFVPPLHAVPPNASRMRSPYSWILTKQKILRGYCISSTLQAKTA
mgnify:CR=1 FL=1